MKFRQMDPIWQNLPDDLAFLVISFMNIDTRLAFKVPPNRLGFKQVEKRHGREQVAVKGKKSRYTFKWHGGSYPSLMVKTPTFDVIIHAKGDANSNGRWTMYVMNKDETAGKVTYYNNDTNKTHEYNIVRNGIGWEQVVV
jgi:hypothetical protein